MAKKKTKPTVPEQRILDAKIATDEVIESLGVEREVFYAGFLPALLTDTQSLVEWFSTLPQYGAELKTMNEHLVKIVNRMDITLERLVQILEVIKGSQAFVPLPAGLPTIQEQAIQAPQQPFQPTFAPQAGVNTVDLSRPETWNQVPQGLPMIPQPPNAPGFPQIAQQPQASIQSFNPQPPIPQQSFVPATQAPPASNINNGGNYQVYGKITGGTELALKIEFQGGKWSFCPKSAVKNMNAINPADTVNYQLFVIKGWKIAEMIGKAHIQQKDIAEVT